MSAAILPKGSSLQSGLLIEPEPEPVGEPVGEPEPEPEPKPVPNVGSVDGSAEFKVKSENCDKSVRFTE